MSRIFKQANWGDSYCPVCGGKEDKEVVLIPIVGTVEGHNAQARQVHLECLLSGAWFYKNNGLIVTEAKQ